MIDFVQKQLEVSERLVNLMLKDFEARMSDQEFWVSMSTGLLKKIQERDDRIVALRKEIAELQGIYKIKEPSHES